MEAVCIDATNSNVLQEGVHYFVFPHGETSFYVSKLNKKSSHTGSYSKDRFKVVEVQQEIPEPEKVEEYVQMDLFEIILDDVEKPQTEMVIISKELLSPLECNKSMKSKAFKDVQQEWSKQVKAIQDFYKCSWFEAREMLIQHRDDEKPIELKI
ncbi:hypothetical protein [Oceanobacillus sp. 1P07AA]|uniref:hypothetical protein n=1 Tax=Oceanobacillus sp. 1P07AA TaxID=3132293 RepID=UPI0039A5B875